MIEKEKMTEIQALCKTIVLDLREIEENICDEKYFQAGMTLGCLITSLISLAERDEKNIYQQCDEEE